MAPKKKSNGKSTASRVAVTRKPSPKTEAKKKPVVRHSAHSAATATTTTTTTKNNTSKAAKKAPVVPVKSKKTVVVPKKNPVAKKHVEVNAPSPKAPPPKASAPTRTAPAKKVVERGTLAAAAAGKPPAKKTTKPPTPPPPPQRMPSAHARSKPAPQPQDPLVLFLKSGSRSSSVLLALAHAPIASASSPLKVAVNGSRRGRPEEAWDSFVTDTTKSLTTSPVSAQAVQRELLATVSRVFLLLCCRILQHTAVRTNKAFLSLAIRGRTPPASDDDNDDDEPVAKEEDVLGGGENEEEQADAAHELAYRTVRSTIAASCALGHRSCQVLWGPRGSGKHRVLRLVAADCARQAGTFALQLHGDLLRSDQAALRVVADQMFTFLRSPQSAALRAADPSIENGSFDFGLLFQYPRRLAVHAAMDAAGAHAGGRRRSDGPLRHRADARHGNAEWWRYSNSDGDADNDNDVANDDDEDEEDEESRAADEATMLISSTTAYLSGGAASALSALQRALLLFKSHGVNIVTCVRHVDQFGIWCDQLFYVLSGLMHEGDEHGGGLSLVLSSSAPDIRQLEKRLSSRLTCTTQYIPLLPWTARRLTRASISLLHDFLQCQLGQLLLADRRLAMEHEEDVAAAKDPNKPAPKDSGAAGGGNRLHSKKPGGLHDKTDTLFVTTSAAHVKAYEAVASLLSERCDALHGLLPACLAPLDWYHWLAQTQKPLLAIAEGAVRRQRTAAAKTSMTNTTTAASHASLLAGQASHGARGGVLCPGLLATMHVGWCVGQKRVRQAPCEETVVAAENTTLASGAADHTASRVEAVSSRAAQRDHHSDGDDDGRVRHDDAYAIEEDLTESDLEEAVPPPPTATAVETGKGVGLEDVQASKTQLDSLQSLLEHPTLTLELLVVLCEQVMRELLPRDTVNAANAHTTPALAQQLHKHTREQGAAGATAPEVLAAAATCLTTASSGALPLLSAHGAASVVRWLSARTDMYKTARDVQAVPSPRSGGMALPCLATAVLGPGQGIDSVLASEDEDEGVVPHLRPHATRTGLNACASSSSELKHGSAWARLACRAPTGLRLIMTPLTVYRCPVPQSLGLFWQRVMEGAAAGGGGTAHTPVLAPITTAWLPPDMYDLLDEGSLVTLNYVSREAFILLFYIFQQQQQNHTGGVSGARSAGDLLEDVASSLGTRAAASLDRDAFRAALHQLARWQLIQLSNTLGHTSDAHVNGVAASGGARRGGGGGGGGGKTSHRDGEMVSLCGSQGRLQEFLRLVLDKHVDWCEDVLGLNSKAHIHMRSLV